MPVTGAHSPDFAETLRRLRRERSLTQAELAERAGISVGSISHLERGINRTPHKDTIQLLGAALGLSADELAQLARAARLARATGAAPEPTDAARVSPPEVFGVPLTPLIGRERDEAAVIHLLSHESTRLLTLTGAAGIGKTRLAIQVARTLAADTVRESVFVDLTAVQESDRVLPAIAQALEVQTAGAGSARDALVAALRDRPVLLVLDNFEQVLPAARALVDLLSACPRARALVTSRSRLNVRGEQAFVVAPLALPTAGQLAQTEDLEQFAGVALFLHRARAAQPDFTVATPEEWRMVAAICAQLDGLPLAIELAAARIPHLGLRQLYERLTGPAFLRVLAGGPRDLPDHQRTMTSAVEWSYRLLAPEEQRLFRAISVLVGGATLESARAVSALDDERLLAGLSALVDQSLLQRTNHTHAPRYSQLVTLRAYGSERLEEQGELAEARKRHAGYFLGLVERIVPGLVDQPRELRDLLAAEYENLRAAMLWTQETGAVLQGLRMGGRLWKVWLAGYQMREGLDWLERLLASAPAPEGPADQEIHALAWTGVLVFAHRLRRYNRAREAGEIALRLRRTLGDKTNIAYALNNLANPVMELRDYEHARALYEESMALHRETGHRAGIVNPLLNLGELSQKVGRLDEALTYYTECIALSREVGESEYARALPLNNLGELYLLLDQPEPARQTLSESCQIFAHVNEPSSLALSTLDLGRAEARLGHREAAQAHYHEAAALCREVGDTVLLAQALYHRASLFADPDGAAQAARDLGEALDLLEQEPESDVIWRVVERCGTLACARGDEDAAVRLYAAAEAHRTAGFAATDPADAEVRARDLARLSAALGESTFQEAYATGKRLSLPDALALARRALC